MAYCSACGNQLPPDAAFCPGCGKSAVLVADRGLRPGPVPEALPMLAYPHAGPAAPFPARPPALFFKDLVPSAWQAAAVFGGLLLIATALAGLADSIVQDAGDHGNLGDWLGRGMLLISLGAGGSADGKLTSEYVSGTASLHVMPVLMVLLLVMPVVLLARRTESRQPAQSALVHLARAGTHAFVLAALAGFGGLLATATSQVDDVRVVAGPNAASTTLLTFIIVGAASFLARATVSREPFPPAVREILATVSLITRFWLSFLVITLLAAPLLLLTDVPAAVTLIAVLVALPTGALVLAGVPVSADFSTGLTGLARLLGSESPSGPHDASRGLITDPSRWTLLILVPVLALFVMAVRHTVSHPAAEWRARLRGGAVAGLAAAFAASFFTVALAQQLVFTAALDGGIAGGSVDTRGGPSLAGSVLAGLCWGALAALVLRWAPSFALAAPRLTRWTGQVDQSWADILHGRAEPPAGVLPPRAARWITAAAAVLVVLAGLMVGAQAVVSTVVYSPGKVARAYLQAVGSGNAKQALALFASPPANAAMLTDAVLKADGVQRPERVRTLSTSKEDDNASVQVAFDLGGAEHRMELTLHADPDEKRSGLFPDWRITSSLGTFQNPYTEGGFSPSIAGLAIDGEAGLFPGRYPVAVTDPSAMFEIEPTDVAILGTVADFSMPAATLSTAGKSRIADAVVDELRDCTASEFSYGCPFDAFDVPSYQDEGVDVQFRLETKPYVDVMIRGDGIVAEVTGAVAYTETMYTGPDEVGTIPLSATAEIDLSDGDLTVSFE